jgi:hypothetical protein
LEKPTKEDPVKCEFHAICIFAGIEEETCSTLLGYLDDNCRSKKVKLEREKGGVMIGQNN